MSDSSSKPKPAPPAPSPASISARFRCHQCGNCCRGDGHVFLTAPDLRRLALFLDVTIEELKERHTKEDAYGRVVLRDQADKDKSCVFLDGNRCTVHDAKPEQCRNFPFTWRPPSIAEFCEGWREMIGLPPLGVPGRQRHRSE